MTGVIFIDKEKGLTSFDVCKRLSKIYSEKKCGHTGTLDPLATGLMVVLFGGATRFARFITEEEKSYRASFKLGLVSDTYDVTGNVTETGVVGVTEQDVKDILPRFTGKLTQLPPMYSAVSVGGERLYKLAREGKEVERPSREVEIKNLELIGAENGEYTIDVTCSKGTYIRSLVNDMGRALGCGAVMASLRRTKYAGISLESAVSLSELQAAEEKNKDISRFIHPVDSVLSGKRVIISAKQAGRFQNGGALDLARVKQNIKEKDLCKVYSPSGEFLGLGEATADELRVKRVLVEK